jgi:hypothetical protein
MLLHKVRKAARDMAGEGRDREGNVESLFCCFLLFLAVSSFSGNKGEDEREVVTPYPKHRHVVHWRELSISFLLTKCSPGRGLLLTKCSPGRVLLLTKCSPGRVLLPNKCSPGRVLLLNKCSPRRVLLGTHRRSFYGRNLIYFTGERPRGVAVCTATCTVSVCQ